MGKSEAFTLNTVLFLHTHVHTQKQAHIQCIYTAYLLPLKGIQGKKGEGRSIYLSASPTSVGIHIAWALVKMQIQIQLICRVAHDSTFPTSSDMLQCWSMDHRMT